MQRPPHTVLMFVAAAFAASCATTSSIRVHVSEDVAIQRRVHQIGMRLGSIASRTYRRNDIAWQFYAIERHPFGASASRDGLVAVDAWIAQVLRPDELACVLSHEIGHVIKGHRWPGASAEEAADAFAVWLTIGAGYRPDACVRALERLNGLAGHTQPFFLLNLFTMHPTIEDRIAFTRREVEKYRRR